MPKTGMCRKGKNPVVPDASKEQEKELNKMAANGGYKFIQQRRTGNIQVIYRGRLVWITPIGQTV